MASWAPNTEDEERAMDIAWSLSLVPLAMRGVPLADFEPDEETTQE